MRSGGFVTGDKELAAALRVLSKGPGAREIDGMANRTLSPVRDDVKSRLRAIRNFPSKYSSFFPKQRGKFANHLDKFVVVRKDGKQSVGRRSYRIASTGRGKSLLHLVEYGTAPHAQPNLRFMHPGATPRPVMTPAYEAGHAGVIREFGFEMSNWLVQAGNKLRLKISRGSVRSF